MDTIRTQNVWPCMGGSRDLDTMKLRLPLLPLVLLLGRQVLLAQSEDRFFSQYNFYYITETAGMPHSFVDDIICDSDGFIWVATHNGIGRYDGYRVTAIHSQTAPLGLKNDFVHTLCEDSFKRLWVGSEGGLEIINLDTYTKEELFADAEEELEALSGGYIHRIYKDESGDMWISCNNNVWCIELDKKGNIRGYYCLEKFCQSPVRAIEGVGQEICAGLDNRICVLKKKGEHRLQVSSLSDSLKPYSEDWRISCMQTDGDWLWIGTNRGLFKYNGKTEEMKRYRYSTHRSGMLSQAYITDIKLTERGSLIVSTLNGVNVYHRDTDTFSFIRQSGSQDAVTLNCNAINCICTMGEIIWLGTETGGVNLLSPKRLQTEFWTCPTMNQSVKSPVNAIAEDSLGHLWMGVVERGLVKWNPEENTCDHYSFSPGDVTSLSNNTISGLLLDSDQHLWAYTWGVGINEFDLNVPGNRRFKRYTREEIPTLEGDFINSACEDRLNGGIWFGSTRGVLFFNKAQGTFTRVLFDGLDNEFEAIYALTVDHKKRLWIGTTQGVVVVDLLSFARSHRRFKYTYLKYKLDDPSSMKMEKISCILEDEHGTLWLGGNGSGLYRLTDDEDGRFRFVNYTVRDGLADNTVMGMASDGKGHLWLVTDDGLSKLDVGTMTFANFSRDDGLPFTQFYWNGIHYSPKRDLIFLATNAGMLVLHAEDKAMAGVKPVVKLSSLTIAGNAVYPSSGDYLEESIQQASSITLHEKDSRFTLELTTCNYGNNTRIRFAYRMKGYEEEWNETKPGDNLVRYTAVPPGRYILQIRATDETGRWSDQLTELQVRIVPYFYKSVWFYLLLLVLGCVGVWILYRRKINRYRQQRAILEKKVEERTQELAVQNKQLEVMAQHVKEVTEEKIAFFTNITHEFRTPVTLIHGPIEHALKEVQDEDVRAQLQIAERNSSYLLSLVNELMDFRKLDMDKVVLDRRPCHLVKFLTELLLPFQVFARERGIDIRLYCHMATPCVLLDTAYMRKALVNLVANAVKFTPDNGHICVYAASLGGGEEGGRQLYIDVFDTGYGIVEGDQDRIFDRFFQSKKSDAHPVFGQSGTGIGLFLCRRIVELHGGSVYARNNHGKGASFRILMPWLACECEPDVNEASTVDGGAEALPPKMEEGGSRRANILVVEDNADMRAYIASLLSKDYRMLEASNGEEALQVVQKHHVDLIVSDLMMPVMDGMELSRRIKENLSTSHIPILMLTAISSQVQEKKSFEIGVDEYLCKPFDEEILLLRIRNMLKLRDQYRKRFSASNDVGELHIKEESRDQQFISKALGLMKQHFADSEYNLECFVRDMGYSKTLVNSKMQALAGQSIGQFMKSYRLNVAQRMLQEGNGSANVSEVAYAIGFNDPKYFTKCFKEFFGYLPSEVFKKK
mgnify:FL=1